MLAVILAAGEGSRFRQTVADTPKPCWNLMGVPVIERAIRCAASAGCDEALVITGYAADQVESLLAQRSRGNGGRGSGLPIPVRCLRAPEWARGNGASLLAAAGQIQHKRFLLLMADHVMDPSLPRQAIAASDRLNDDEVLLLVDPRLDRVFDVDEATKVRLKNRRVAAIGKGLEQFDGIDTGVFIGSQYLLQVLSELDDGNSPLTITGAAQRLVDEGKLAAELVSGGWWIDVDDSPALRQAEKLLLKAATASGGDGPVAKWLNRPISSRFTAAVAGTRLTPTAITLIAFVLALLGAGAFALGLPWLGGLLVQISSILDGSDGELARLRFQSSPAGSLLDTILDRYADAAVVAGLLAGALGQSANPLLLVAAALATMAGSPLSALIKDRIQWLEAQQGKSVRYNPLRDDPRWLSWLPVNRDGRCFVIFLAGLIGKPGWALALLAVVVHVAALTRLFHGMRRLSA